MYFLDLSERYRFPISTASCQGLVLEWATSQAQPKHPTLNGGRAGSENVPLIYMTRMVQPIPTLPPPPTPPPPSPSKFWSVIEQYVGHDLLLIHPNHPTDPLIERPFLKWPRVCEMTFLAFTRLTFSSSFHILPLVSWDHHHRITSILSFERSGDCVEHELHERKKSRQFTHVKTLHFHFENVHTDLRSSAKRGG